MIDSSSPGDTGALLSQRRNTLAHLLVKGSSGSNQSQSVSYSELVNSVQAAKLFIKKPERTLVNYCRKSTHSN
ncbi:hypothetical protein chiPu_0015970 [Chiloscyllium punctatum]|uniref:Uncharacterized protein n=1 Tax=Chiloscyllium punctatum TaxID=137246 RepID=A0A401T470_CHIPU|nr:hypothetical protein [Chiloscyllium punctatum]